MSDDLIVQYVGFKTTDVVREYSFLVRQPPNEPREFTLSIGNEAFDARRVRYQDAPDICSVKLHKELAASANEPSETTFQISEADLDDYRGAHTSKTKGKLFSPKAAQEY
jgi:hypothetical protein